MKRKILRRSRRCYLPMWKRTLAKRTPRRGTYWLASKPSGWIRSYRVSRRSRARSPSRCETCRRLSATLSDTFSSRAWTRSMNSPTSWTRATQAANPSNHPGALPHCDMHFVHLAWMWVPNRWEWWGVGAFYKPRCYWITLRFNIVILSPPWGFQSRCSPSFLVSFLVFS